MIQASLLRDVPFSNSSAIADNPLIGAAEKSFGKLAKKEAIKSADGLNLMALESRRDATAQSDQEQSSELHSEAQDNRERQAVVRRIMSILRASFERKTWQAFWRVVVDGCSPDDVATGLSMSRWSVYKARARVLQRLREEVSGLEELE